MAITQSLNRLTLNRWYAEFVRNTNNNPKADTRKEWAVPDMHMLEVTYRSAGCAQEALVPILWTRDTRKDQAATAITGLRISRNTLDCGNDFMLYNQSDAECRLFIGSSALVVQEDCRRVRGFGLKLSEASQC